MFWIELIVVLGMLLKGARVGGIFLGMSSGVALAILVFGFGCTPGSPAIDVIMIIMTVVVAASVLQASGGERMCSSFSFERIPRSRMISRMGLPVVYASRASSADFS